MTQEEKAKRYDEVVKEIKGFFEGKQKMPNDVDKTLELLFPELKENEDEKIRKALICGMYALKEQHKTCFASIPIDDCIAWLKKQSDKDELIKELDEYKAKYTQEVLEKHLRAMNKNDERLRKTTIAFLKDFADKGYENAIECIDWLEKKGEQKFAEGTFVNVDDVREDFVQEVYRVLDADSTNDRANQIIDAFDNLPTVTIKQDPCDNCENVMLNCHNFPCIKKRAFKQGKSALEAINEEKVDNQFCAKPVNETSIAVNNPDSYKIGFADGEAYVKEQQWKPSDGQMEVLKGIIADKYVLDAYKGILKGLQEQLKKLRGE